MKKSLLILSILLISNNSFAQLIETMGALGIQGSMTNQAVTQTKKMNDAVKMDSFLRAFNEKVVMMQINGIDGYSGGYKIDEGGYRAEISTINSTSFKAVIPSVNKELCERMISRSWDGAVSVQINNKTYYTSEIQSLGFEVCPQKSSLTFIFE